MIALTVVGIGAVFAQIMLVEERVGHGFDAAV